MLWSYRKEGNEKRHLTQLLSIYENILALTKTFNAHILFSVGIQEDQKTEHRAANGLHDDVVTLKVDVATLKEQGKHFATKEDVAEVRTDIAEGQAENQKAFAELRAENQKAFAELRAENQKALAELRDENQKAFAELRDENQKKFAELQTENQKKFAELRAENQKKFAELQAENKADMAAMDNKIETAKNELLQAFNRTAMRVIAVLVSMMAALLGTIVTIILK